MAEIQSKETPETHSEALETAVSFLRSLSDHVVADAKAETEQVRAAAGAWVRHLSIGGVHPETKETRSRDFAGARRFASRTLRNHHAVQIKTNQELRQTTWAFAAELHEIVSAEASDDTELKAGLEVLKGAVAEGSVETLRQAANELTRKLFSLLMARNERHAVSVRRAAERLPAFLDLVQRGENLSVDASTGLLDLRSLVDIAERVHVLADLAKAPVTVSLITVADTGLRKDELDALMASLTPAFSRAFLSRNDILGRESEASFAVIAAGRDVANAQQAAERARALLLGAMEKENTWKNVALSFGVAPLRVPILESFAQARRR
jgi:hypothetical protein